MSARKIKIWKMLDQNVREKKRLRCSSKAAIGSAAQLTAPHAQRVRASEIADSRHILPTLANDYKY
jgi:hypothetical protein